MQVFESTESWDTVNLKDFYKDDMRKIYAYLQDVGKVNVTKITLYNYYCDFCSEYYKTDFMTPTDESNERFAKWLIRQEI